MKELYKEHRLWSLTALFLAVFSSDFLCLNPACLSGIILKYLILCKAFPRFPVRHSCYTMYLLNTHLFDFYLLC